MVHNRLTTSQPTLSQPLKPSLQALGPFTWGGLWLATYPQIQLDVTHILRACQAKTLHQLGKSLTERACDDAE